MDLARAMPLGSKIWASEIMRGAPAIQDFLDTTLTQWVRSRERVVRRWIADGKLKPIEPRVLLYMIWATTQQYANAAHEIATLEHGELSRRRVRARQAADRRDDPRRRRRAVAVAPRVFKVGFAGASLSRI